MVEKLILKINRYIGYLNKECGLNVSVHFDQNILYCLPQKIVPMLLEYNSHTNPYCIAVKRTKHHECVLYQQSIIKSGVKESFFNMCHAGVLEYVHPIFKAENTIGFVVASGYRNKVLELSCAKADLWEMALSDEEIPKVLCDTLIPPLCIMLEQLFELYAKESANEFNQLIQFLNEYHNNVTLADLCEHFGRSKSYISHMFKRESGMTIKAYCNKLKLADSKKLLLETDFSMTEIAFDTGFNDVSYFIYLFKKEFGISPLKYRKNNLN